MFDRSQLEQMSVPEFTENIALPIALLRARKITDGPEMLYDGRDDRPMLLASVSAELFEQRDSLPNRHRVFDANVCYNGSLDAGGPSAIVKSGTPKRRLIRNIAQLIAARPDCARIFKARHGLTVQSIDTADDATLIAAFKTLRDGGLNLEYRGFYVAACDPKTSTFASPLRPIMRKAIEFRPRIGYMIRFAPLASVLAAAEKKTTKLLAAKTDAREKRTAKKTAKKTDSADK